MQDLLVYVTKGISAITTALRQEGKQVSAKINHDYSESVHYHYQHRILIKRALNQESVLH
ncbi:MAG: hypothetical protein ACLU6F_00825 [[Ruminococcus] torques]